MPDYSHLCSWIDNQEKVLEILDKAPHPYFRPFASAMENSGKGKKSNNVAIIRKVMGHFPYMIQAVSDCVAFGYAGAHTCLRALQAYINRLEGVVEYTSTEDVYGGSRILIGKGQLGRGGGSVGIWAVEYGAKYGNLLRKPYGRIDLTNYSGQRAEEWGNNGVPKELLPFAKEHLLTVYSQVRTWEELVQALYNGYPITIASNRGFRDRTDKDGFLVPGPSWAHQMYAIDYRDFDRKGALIVNSWPKNWISGQKLDNNPDGTGWVDKSVIEEMLSARDSYALSTTVGYKAQDLNLGGLFG